MNPLRSPGGCGGGGRRRREGRSSGCVEPQRLPRRRCLTETTRASRFPVPGAVKLCQLGVSPSARPAAVQESPAVGQQPRPGRAIVSSYSAVWRAHCAVNAQVCAPDRFGSAPRPTDPQPALPDDVINRSAERTKRCAGSIIASLGVSLGVSARAARGRFGQRRIGWFS